MILNPKKSYLQIALNNTLDEAYSVIQQLPISDRVIVEVGTPLIKAYGEEAIRKICSWYRARTSFQDITANLTNLSGLGLMGALTNAAKQANQAQTQTSSKNTDARPYVVADLKTMDRGETEVDIAYRGGACAAIALGLAPTETLDSFIAACKARGMDSMIDMMNVEYSLGILQKLKQQPDVVILHRGVDEENFNKEKQIPLHEIRRIKSRYDMMVSVAGGDTIREVQRSIFNDADIVVIWKSVFQSTSDTAQLVKDFLNEIQ